MLFERKIHLPNGPTEVNLAFSVGIFLGTALVATSLAAVITATRGTTTRTQTITKKKTSAKEREGKLLSQCSGKVRLRRCLRKCLNKRPGDEV
jgi:hypothetical protein